LDAEVERNKGSAIDSVEPDVIARLCALCDQPSGNRIGLRVELGVRNGLFRSDDGWPVRIFLRRLAKMERK